MMAVVAGIGFRRAAPASEIVALVERALVEAALARGTLRGLATAARLADAAAFREAARRLAVAALAVDPAALAGSEDRLRTRSARSLAAHGVGSVAEAAALGAIGHGARLILPRIASPAVTCALAQNELAESRLALDKPSHPHTVSHSAARDRSAPTLPLAGRADSAAGRAGWGAIRSATPDGPPPRSSAALRLGPPREGEGRACGPHGAGDEDGA